MNNRLLPAFVQRFVFAACFLTSMFAHSSAYAQTYIFPGSNTTYTGGANSWPFNAIVSTSSTSNMCQWLYLPGDFNTTPPTSGINITSIYIKPSNATNTTYTNLQIKLGNTTLTTLTTGAWNTGLTTVYFNSSATISTTANTWLQFTLSTPFFYSGGGLILEISQQNTASVSGITLNQFSVTSRNGRMYGNTANTTGTADNATAVFGFDAAPANCSGTPAAATITNTAYTAAAPLCAGSTVTLNATNPNLGNGITQQWQSSSSASGPFVNVTGGSGATTLAYTTAPVATSTYFRLGVTCTNSLITTYSSPFLVPVGTPQPGVITGPTATFCPGDTATYSVPNVAGTTYTWTIPSGWSGASTTNAIFVTHGATAGTVSVTATSACGPTSISRTFTPTPGSAPASPGTINGATSICGGTTQTYSVAPVAGATFYIWTLPSGWTGTSTSTSITTTTNNTPGTVTVKAANGCGQSGSNSIAVSVITALANPGTITGTAAACSGNLYSYSIAPVPGATSYVWTLPSGWSGTTTGTSIQAFAGSAGGNLTVTAYVACATSPIATKAVTVTTTVTPAVSIATAAATLCQSAPILFTATPTAGGAAPTYQWKKNGVNVYSGGAGYTDNSLVSGDIITVVMTSNAACASTPSVTSNAITANVTPTVTPGININTVPPITICRGQAVTFTTNTTGGGPSTPGYQWYKNGIIITPATGPTYTDNTLNNTDTLTVVMTTTAVCKTMPTATSNKVGIKVIENVIPSVSVSVSPSEIITSGTALTFTATQSNGGTTPDYQWQKNGVDIAGETGSTYTSSSLLPGDYIGVKMLSYAPCASPEQVVSNIIILKSTLGIAGVSGSWEGSVRLYPNPSSGRFTVSAEWGAGHNGQRVSVDVLSAVGQSVYHGELSSLKAAWQTEVELGAGVANGRYLLRLSSGDGMKATVPFVLSR